MDSQNVNQPKSKRIPFRDYENYPKNIMTACEFRDNFDDLPDGAFFAVAEEQGVIDDLIEMAEWEMSNTDIQDNEVDDG